MKGMNTQSGVFAFGATEHLFLTFDLTAGADVQEALQILAQAGNPATTDMVNVVVGVPEPVGGGCGRCGCTV